MPHKLDSKLNFMFNLKNVQKQEETCFKIAATIKANIAANSTFIKQR